MNKILLFIAFFLTILTNAQNITFADPDFKNRLLSADASNPTARNSNGENITVDINGNGEISASEALLVYELHLDADTSIDDLTGISYFTNLVKLYATSTQLTFVELSALDNLEEAWLQGLPLTGTLDMSGCASLKELRCDGGQYETLNVSGLANLELLWCSNGPITTINMEGCYALKELHCDSGQLTSLNCSGFSELDELLIYDNQIAEIDLTGCESLQLIYIWQNELESIDLSELVSLKYLAINENHITELNLSSVDLLALAVQNNPLASIDLSEQVNLEGLQIDYTGITSLDVSMCAQLSNINCSGLTLTELDLSNNPNLWQIIIKDSEITSLNIKNGNVDFVNSEETGASLEGSDSLMFICADEEDFDTLATVLPLWGIEPQYNTYCSATPVGDYNTITGVLTHDAENDGCTGNDPFGSFMRVSVDDGINSGVVYANTSGLYNFYTQEGSFTITPLFENDWFSATPASSLVDFETTDNLSSSENFCIVPNGNHPDIETMIVPITPSQPGFDAVYKIVFKNKGNQVLSGDVIFSYDDTVLDLILAVPAQASAATSQLTWNYVNLQPFENRSITVTLNVNGPMETPAVNIDDILSYAVTCTPTTGDETPADNVVTYNETVVGSYDPNDKTCLEGDMVTPEMIGEYLHYNINFENTGTAPATFIVVKDVINPEQFDINTLQVLNASHDMMVRVEGNTVEFRFDAINLGPLEKGNVLFKVKTLNTLQIGDEVLNFADIFFDYNFPITTNEATTSFGVLGTGDFEVDSSVMIYPNPTNGLVNITADSNLTSLQLYDLQGRLLQTVLPNDSNAVLDMTSRVTGVYLLKVTSEKGVKVEKIINE